MNTVAEIDFAPARPEIVADKPASLPATLAPEAATIFQIIERAARDPGVDIDKMERLILMQERVQSRAAEVEFDNAMSDAQQEMQPVRADANNPQTKSKYASYNALDNAIRPIYARHGFSLSFDTEDGAMEGCIRIVCKVAHRGGHRERPRIDMPADGKGAKGGDVMTRTHATGSAITYGKRYLLNMIFNIAVGENDDDGNSAGGHRPGAPGSAGGGAQFRSDGPRRSSPGEDVSAGNLRWVEQQKAALIALTTEKDVIAWNAKNAKQLQKLHNENESLWNDLAAVFRAAKVRTQGKSAPDEKTAKITAAVDKRIKALKEGKPWTRAGLSDFWREDKTWIDWMSDPNNGALEEYERFTTAFADAELTTKEIM